MIRLLYSLLLTLLIPVWLPGHVKRTKRRAEAPNWAERWGKYDIPPPTRPRIWIHAVSVGEVMAAKPILSKLRESSPDCEILLTTTTSTGQEIALGLKNSLVDYVAYFPFDLPWACKRAVAQARPDIVVMMETELWFNFLHFAKRFGAKTFIANGRISDHSFVKAMRWAFFYRRVLANVDECWMQSDLDKERITALGGKHVLVLGNTKFDEPLPSTPPTDWRSVFEDSSDLPIVVIGSIRGEGEEDFVLRAIAGLRAKVIIAPRHVERAGQIAALAKALGWNPVVRSAGDRARDLLILDTYGELSSIYAVADLAIIGGGFEDLGGQNLIQPLAAGCPVVCGTHMQNFREAYEAALESGAAVAVSTREELRAEVDRLLGDAEKRAAMGRAGRALVEGHSGASTRIATKILEALQTLRGADGR